MPGCTADFLAPASTGEVDELVVREAGAALLGLVLEEQVVELLGDRRVRTRPARRRSAFAARVE